MTESAPAWPVSHGAAAAGEEPSAWPEAPSEGLEERTRGVFVPGGVLARAAEAFRPRSGQTEMAVAVARTIAQGGALVVEAGTGVGKTFS